MSAAREGAENATQTETGELNSLRDRVKRGEALLNAICEANLALESDNEFNRALRKCLEAFGRSVGLDRLTIHRSHPHPSTGAPAHTLVTEWCNDGVDSLRTRQDRADVPWDPQLTRWREAFEQGEPVSASVADLPDAERAYFEAEGRKSVLVMPIYSDGKWWGTISFDEFHVQRTWTEAEVASLRSLAHSIGTTAARRRAEGFLRQSEELHRTIVDNSKDVIFVLALGGGIVFASPSWRQALGHDPDDVLGLAIEDLVHPDDVEPCRQFLRDLAVNPEMEASIEYRVGHIDGSWRIHSTSGSLVFNDEGVPEVFVGVAKDVTDRTEYEHKLQTLATELTAANEALTEARDKALQASMAKSQFLANMSHEIRTPLNGVIGMTSLLLDQSLDDEVRGMVRSIQTSGETLLRVIDDVLDFSKIEVGRLGIELTPVELGSLVADVVSLYQGHARSKGIRLFQSAPESALPTVMADPVRLRQVLANLVANGTKFTHEGEVAVEWSWERSGDDANVTFRVRDTGIGIPEDKLETVFGRFIQVDNSTHRRYGGSGLGLAICKRLVELMEGRIGVESTVGSGSVFTVELTLKLAGDQEAEAEDRPSDSKAVWEREVRVLLAEDNRVNILVAKKLLERCGCLVDIAEDGLSAISQALAKQYDLILMDMQMPTCDGVEATQALRQHEGASGTRRTIIALTANAMADDRRTCMEAGMDDFLAKPITLATLREMIGKWVRPETASV